MDIKKTVEDLKDKAEDAMKDPETKKKIEEALEKTDIDDKIRDKVGGLTDKFKK